ncbi:MAG: nucleotidyl transferase AbiEii/AbiGii toxin family protein [Thermoanaerobaculia bacterium]
MSDRTHPLRDVLSALAAVLDRTGTRWYVFGAQAVVVYGRPRLTADIDVTVDVRLESWQELEVPLLEAGFSPRVEDLQAFVERTRVLPLAHDPSGIPVDLVLAGPVGLEQEFLDRVRRVDMGGLRVPLISPVDLVVTKILAGRPKDLEDVRGILREQAGGLDLDSVRELLARLEKALDRRDLLTELERLHRGED